MSGLPPGYFYQDPKFAPLDNEKPDDPPSPSAAQHRMLADVADLAAMGRFAGCAAITISPGGDLSVSFTSLRPTEAIGMLMVAIRVLEKQLGT